MEVEAIEGREVVEVGDELVAGDLLGFFNCFELSY